MSHLKISQRGHSPFLTRHRSMSQWPSHEKGSWCSHLHRSATNRKLVQWSLFWLWLTSTWVLSDKLKMLKSQEMKPSKRKNHRQVFVFAYFFHISFSFSGNFYWAFSQQDKWVFCRWIRPKGRKGTIGLCCLFFLQKCKMLELRSADATLKRSVSAGWRGLDWNLFSRTVTFIRGVLNKCWVI